MPGRQAVLNDMKNKARGAPKSSQVRIDTLLDLYETEQLNSERSLGNAIVARRHPMLFDKKKVEEFYQKATGQFLRKKRLPYNLKMEYTLKVLLFTDVSKSDPDKDRRGEMDLDKESQQKYKKFLTMKYPNHRRFWAGTLNVRQGSAQFFSAVR